MFTFTPDETFTGISHSRIKNKTSEYLSYMMREFYPDRYQAIGSFTIVGSLKIDIDWMFSDYGSTRPTTSAECIHIDVFEVDMLDTDIKMTEWFCPVTKQFIHVGDIKKSNGITLKDLMEFVNPVVEEELSEGLANQAEQDMVSVMSSVFKEMFGITKTEAKVTAGLLIHERGDDLNFDDPYDQENVRLAIQWFKS